MKKLFSFVCILALISSITVLVGCNGLWGFDGDDDVVGPTGINYTLKNKVVIDSAAMPNLMAAAANSGYNNLVANLYKVSDNSRITASDVDVKDNGDVDDITFVGAAATFTVRITHPNKPSFFLAKLVNQTDSGKAATPVDVTTTAIALIASANPTLNYTQISTTDDLVKGYITTLTTYLANAAATTSVIVVPAAPTVVPVTGLTLNKSTLSLSLSAVETLVATIVPANATTASVTWTTSNALVATVDSTGKVTAVSGGVANITATSVGNTAVSATCAVTVTVPVTGISLDKATLSMEDGSNSTLVATIAPAEASNKNVTWTSSDVTVATVDQTGKITSLKPGTTTITVASVEKTTITATCAVTVTAVAVTGVTLNKTTTSLVTGLTETLTATLAPANATVKTVTWSSSNTAVATVSSAGLVTAVTAGTANITVTTTDGSKTAVCGVTVTAAAVAVTGVTLNKATTSIAVGVKETLVATVAPTTASNNTVTWSTSNSSIAIVSNTGEVTAVALGNATITVTTADGSKTATCVVTVTAAPTTTTVTFTSVITGATNTMAVVLKNSGDNWAGTMTLTAIDNTSMVFSVDALTSASLANGVILKCPDIKTIKDFQSMTFSAVLPSGTVVQLSNVTNNPSVTVP